MAEIVQETSPAANQPGVYEDPESGARVIVKSHPKFGNAQADGFVRAGWRHVGPVPEGDRATGSALAQSEPEQPKSAAQLREELAEAEARELSEKPFDRLNKTELQRLAELEGVKLTDEHDTNDKMRAAITEAREKRSKE